MTLDGTPILGVVARRGAQTPEQLLPLVYNELRRVARARLAHHAIHQSLTATELVHVAYLRVTGNRRRHFEGQRHFFFAASRAMRDILIEGLRRRASLKRGGSYRRVDVAAAQAAQAAPRPDVIDLDRAMAKLECECPERAHVVQLSYFCGLTHPEIADVLGLSRATVERRWSYARAWLRRELAQPGSARSY